MHRRECDIVHFMSGSRVHKILGSSREPRDPRTLKQCGELGAHHYLSRRYRSFHPQIGRRLRLRRGAAFDRVKTSRGRLLSALMSNLYNECEHNVGTP